LDKPLNTSMVFPGEGSAVPALDIIIALKGESSEWKPESTFELRDLRSPPGNRLEALHADREGQHSIRINDQWRICFAWTATGPEAVEIVNYH